MSRRWGCQLSRQTVPSKPGPAASFRCLRWPESAGLRELADEHLSVSTRAPSATSVSSTRSLPGY